jgi:hypothetical protein
MIDTLFYPQLANEEATIIYLKKFYFVLNNQWPKISQKLRRLIFKKENFKFALKINTESHSD